VLIHGAQRGGSRSWTEKGCPCPPFDSLFEAPKEGALAPHKPPHVNSLTARTWPSCASLLVVRTCRHHTTPQSDKACACVLLRTCVQSSTPQQPRASAGSKAVDGAGPKNAGGLSVR
jgi:hypothetical protein